VALIPPVRGDVGVGVQRAPVDAGTAGAAAGWLLAFRTKSRADMPDLLAGPFPKGDALLHRGRHGTGEFGGVIPQWVITCRHRGVEAHFQVPQLTELAHDPMADRLDHGGNVGIGRRLTCDKAWRAPLVGAIQIDPLKADT
jgi:hypothetical protein